jgi:hypothetical protein
LRFPANHLDVAARGRCDYEGGMFNGAPIANLPRDARVSGRSRLFDSHRSDLQAADLLLLLRLSRP